MVPFFVIRDIASPPPPPPPPPHPPPKFRPDLPGDVFFVVFFFVGKKAPHVLTLMFLTRSSPIDRRDDLIL